MFEPLSLTNYKINLKNSNHKILRRLFFDLNN